MKKIILIIVGVGTIITVATTIVYHRCKCAKLTKLKPFKNKWYSSRIRF